PVARLLPEPPGRRSNHAGRRASRRAGRRCRRPGSSHRIWAVLRRHPAGPLSGFRCRRSRLCCRADGAAQPRRPVAAGLRHAAPAGTGHGHQGHFRLGHHRPRRLPGSHACCGHGGSSGPGSGPTDRGPGRGFSGLGSHACRRRARGRGRIAVLWRRRGSRTTSRRRRGSRTTSRRRGGRRRHRRQRLPRAAAAACWPDGSAARRVQEVAAGALERLCEVVKSDAVLAAGLGAHPAFLPRLRDLLMPRQPSAAGTPATPAAAGSCLSRGSSGGASRASASGEQPTAERLAMYAAYLVSVLAGKSQAIDTRLLELRFVPALAIAAAGSGDGAWGVKRGTLRALAKLLAAQPAFAAAQLVACGGVEAVAALLPGDGCTRGNCGISRRCLAILHAVAEVTPDSAGISAALMLPESLAALVRLLGCSSAHSRHEAATLVLLLLGRGGAGAARVLAAAGAGPALVALTGSEGSCEAARGLAAQALSSMQVLLGPGWQPAMPVQHPHLAASLQRAASSGTPAGPRGGTAVQALSLGRAASAPVPAGEVPAADAGSSPGVQQGPAVGSLGSGGGGGFARVQRWQVPPLPPHAQQRQKGSSRAASPAAGSAVNAGQRPPAGPGGATSVAGLLAALGSAAPRAQLAAAEQLGALAACGGRAAAVIAAAGGAEALAACVCESAAGPVDIQDTMADAFEAALSQSVCTAALRTLCTLLQQQPAAAAGLPPAAAAALRLLLAGPDAQQRQLATMVLACMQDVGADPMAGSEGTGGSQLLLPAAAAARVGGAAGAAAAASPSPDLLPTQSLSLLSELPTSSPLAARGQEGAWSLQSGEGALSADTPSMVPAAPRVHIADSPTGRSEPSSSGSRPPLNLGLLPPQVRRQLGEQLQLLQRPPRPPSVHSAGRQDPPSPAGWAGGSRHAHFSVGQGSSCYEPEQAVQQGGDLWGPNSGGSIEPAVAALEGESAGGNSGNGAEPWAGGAESSGAAQVERSASSGLLLTRSDIAICKDPKGRDWRLGEGGFGVVFKGLMNGVDEVAVKRIKAEAPSDAELAAFHREVRVLASLRHRNLVQFYGACLEPDSLMIVTELMKGGDLYTALRRHPQALAWGRLGRKVLLDVALGLNYLHRWLAEEGTAKIADVGMLRRQASELITAQPVMTPLWSAPEVLRRERAGVKADIWSVGVLCWEIVSGRDITELQPLAMARQLQAAQGTQPGGAGDSLALPPDAPPMARLIFESCTQLDPALRPNAAQLVEWLRAGG
ncbi:hypothetical protein ABPG75_010079, partial [Micractinium tetrahymenae]